MTVYRLLFPHENRSFWGKRWVRVLLRTAHLVGTAGFGAGFLYQGPKALWEPYLSLTLASGVAIVVLELWSNAVFLVQLRGVAIVVKLGLLSCLHFCEGYAALTVVVIVIISGIISHAPGDVRYFSVLHGRRLDAL